MTEAAKAVLKAAQAAKAIQQQNPEAMEKTVGNKDDVLTIADGESQRILDESLPTQINDLPIGWTAEEEDAPKVHTWTNDTHLYRWVVDPIDGTKQFAAGTSDYCINVALQHRASAQQAWETVGGLIYNASDIDSPVISAQSTYSEEEQKLVVSGDNNHAIDRTEQLHGALYVAEKDSEGVQVIDYNSKAPVISTLKKPDSTRIPNVVEFETKHNPQEEASMLAETKQFANIFKPEFTQEGSLLHGAQRTQRRSIANAMIEVLEGRSRATIQGPAAHIWDVAPAMLICEKAGAHSNFSPAKERSDLFYANVTFDDQLHAHVEDTIKAIQTPPAFSPSSWVGKVTRTMIGGALSV